MTKSYALCVFLLLALVAQNATGVQDRLVFPNVMPARLLNDLQVYAASSPYLGDAMTIGLELRYGSTFDPANKGGVAYLTSQLIGKATLDKNAKDVQDELNYLNATLEVRCTWDGIRFFMRGQSALYERSLLLLYQIIGEARFDEADFALAKSALIQQLQAPQDPRLRTRNLLDTEMFRGTTYGRSLHGSPASVQNIAVGDVRYFYRRYFSPDQAALVVVSAAESQAVLQKARRIWGVWVKTDEVPFTFLPPKEPGARNIFLEDDPLSPAAQFVLGNLWPRRDEPLYPAGILAVRILQERLTRILPTSLLTVAAEGRRLQGPFSIQGQAAADQAVAEIGKILEAVEALKESGASAEEAAKAQAQWIEEYGKLIGATDGICDVLLDAELYRLGTNYLGNLPDLVRRSTPDQIKEAAKRWLFPGSLFLIVRGPAAALKPQLDALGTVQFPRR